MFTPGVKKIFNLHALAPFKGLKFFVASRTPKTIMSSINGAETFHVFTDPRREESVSKLVSEPGAVATGSNISAKLGDPVAIALGSDTDSERLG